METSEIHDADGQPATPLRVAVVNDFEVVVHGVRTLLAQFPGRVEVVETAVGDAADSLVDVALIDTFGFLDDAVARGKSMMADGSARAVVIYTWDVERAEEALGIHDGFAGVIAKTATAEQLVEAIERVAVGDLMTTAPAGAHAAVAAPSYEPLSQRELEVVAYMADGLTNREIAEAMGVSLETVKTFARRAFPKLGVKNRAQAAAWAAQAGLRRLQSGAA